MKTAKRFKRRYLHIKIVKHSITAQPRKLDSIWTCEMGEPLIMYSSRLEKMLKKSIRKAARYTMREVYCNKLAVSSEEE